MRKLLIVAAALCCITFRLSAQEEDSTVLHFSLEEAMSYALEHNWDLQNSSLAVRQAEADRWAAMEMSDVTRRQSQQEVAEQVRLLYFSALVSGQTLELLDRNLETVRRLHEFSQKSVDAGVAEQVDADQILVQVATLETSINEARRGLEMIYNSMRLQMNIGFDKEIVLTQTLDELMDVEHSLDLLYDDFILENNFSYQLALKSTDLYRQQKNLAGWAYGPTLSAFYQYTGRKYFSDEMTMNRSSSTP